MPTPFELAAAMASASLDQIFGEVFEIAAMKAAGDVNSPKIADETRPSFSVAGILTLPSNSTFPRGNGAIRDISASRITVTTPRLSADRRLLRWSPRQGDRVTRIKTGDVYEINKVLPDASSVRTVFGLTNRKAGAPQ